MSQDDSHEPVTITDKRRINPVTGEVREAPAPPSGGERSDAASPSVAAPTGPASVGAAILPPAPLAAALTIA